jgi:hypothetical protein
VHNEFIKQQTVLIDVSLEAFHTTEFNEIFSGSGAVCAGGLVLPNYQHTLKMGTDLFPETSEELHILKHLSVQEDFIDCKLNSPKTKKCPV